jgi:hypothetical protein
MVKRSKCRNPAVAVFIQSLRDFAFMKILRSMLFLPCLCLAIGCGEPAQEPPPALTPDVQAQIEAEDAAIADAERNNN